MLLFLVFVVSEALLVVASRMWSSSLRRAVVLPLLRFLICGVGVVEEDCLVYCLLWRLLSSVWCFFSPAMCSVGAIGVGRCDGM